MKSLSDIPNSLICIQALDKNIKYNLLSNNTSSINQLNPTNSGSFTSSNLMKSNLRTRNKGSIFGNFFKNEKNSAQNKVQGFYSIKKNFEKEILTKYRAKIHLKNYKKKDIENDFEPKKMMSPQFVLKLLDDIEKKTLEGQSLHKIYKIHSIISILIVINLICSFIDNILNKEKSYSYLQKILKKEPLFNIALKELKNRKLTNIENFFRIISIITAILNFILLTIKEYFIQKYNIKFQNLTRRLAIYLVCSFCFPAKINPIYIIQQNDCIYPVFLVDIYFLLNISKFYILSYINIGNTRYGTLLTQSICRSYSVKPGHLFSIRARILDNPFIYILTLYSIFSIITVFILRTFEFGTFMTFKSIKENNEISFRSPINAFWFIYVISFGIAFGDYYPKTILSRFLIFGLITLLLVIFSFFLKKIMTFTIMSENEKKAYLKMKKLYSPENNEYKAVNVLLFLLKIRECKLLLNKEENKESKSFLRKKLSIYILMLNRHIKNFENNYKIADAFTIPVDDLLKTVEKKIHENLLNFENSFDKLEKINNDLNDLKDLQNKINDNLLEILNYEKIIGNYIIDANNQGILTKIKKKMSKNEIYRRNSRDITLNNEIIVKKLSQNLNLSVLDRKLFIKPPPLKKKRKSKDSSDLTRNNKKNILSHLTFGILSKIPKKKNSVFKKHFLDSDNY